MSPLVTLRSHRTFPRRPLPHRRLLLLKQALDRQGRTATATCCRSTATARASAAAEPAASSKANGRSCRSAAGAGRRTGLARVARTGEWGTASA